MESTGNFFLILTFALTLTAVFIRVWGKKVGLGKLNPAGRFMTGLMLVSISIAMICLLYLLLTGDMHVDYVASYTSRDLHWVYKISALWAGQSGSLLLWSFILIALNAVFAFRFSKKHPMLQEPVCMILMLTQLFFLAMNIWAVNPFKVLVIETPGGPMPYTPFDGNGLNPLLHHPAMIIHPPMLFIGYIGSVIPFAIAVSYLWRMDNSDCNTELSRRWLLFSWLFLTAGIALGSWWAYAELGWGGYWAWDPVENASLMPWLIATALIHTMLIQLRRGLFKKTNLILAATFYFFCILGTFITRSGLINSVHAFSKSGVGIYFVIFLSLIAFSFLILFFYRRSDLADRKPVTDFYSDESMIVLLTIILIVFTIAVLVGTLFPALAEGIAGKVIILETSYYNRLVRFIGILILMTITLSCFIKTYKLLQIKKLILMLICTAIYICSTYIMYLFTDHLFIAFFSGLMTLAGLSILVNLYFLFSQVLKIKAEKGFFFQFKKHIAGAFLSHLGLLFICLGIMGSALNRSLLLEGHPGQVFEHDNLHFTIDGFRHEKNMLYESITGVIPVTANHDTITILSPEFRYYYSSQQNSSEVAICSGLNRDIYAVLSRYDESTHTGQFLIYFNPLVWWIWAGCLLIISGGFFSFFYKPVKASEMNGYKHV